MDLQDHLDRQGFRVLAASMESDIRGAKGFLGNPDHQEIPVNGAARGFRGFVTSLRVIRPTTSGNITAKVPTCDETERGRGWEGFGCITDDSFRPTNWREPR